MHDFKLVKLGDLYTVHNGLSKPGSYFGKGEQFLSFSTVFNNVFLPDVLPDLVDSTKEEQTSFSIKKGDIFITRTSETLDELGMSSVSLKDYPKATFNGFCKRLRQKENIEINPKYVGYYLRTPQFRKEFLKYSAMTTRASLKNDDLLKMKIPCPDFNTQTLIANKFDDINNLIKAEKKLLLKKHNLKDAALQRLLPQKLSEVELKDCVDFINGVAHESYVSESGEYILVNSKFISSEGSIVKYASKQLIPIEKHSILMVMSDVPNGKAIGKCFYVHGDCFKGTLNQRICMLKVKEGINSEFLFRLLNRNKYFLAFDDGVKQTNLRKADVLGCPISLPDYSEQIRIASILSTMDSEISLVESKITKLENLKTAMMQKMFCFEEEDE